MHASFIIKQNTQQLVENLMNWSLWFLVSHFSFLLWFVCNGVKDE